MYLIIHVWKAKSLYAQARIVLYFCVHMWQTIQSLYLYNYHVWLLKVFSYQLLHAIHLSLSLLPQLFSLFKRPCLCSISALHCVGFLEIELIYIMNLSLSYMFMNVNKLTIGITTCLDDAIEALLRHIREGDTRLYNIEILLLGLVDFGHL